MGCKEEDVDREVWKGGGGRLAAGINMKREGKARDVGLK